MVLYRVHFVDHGDNVYATEYLEHDDDESGIAAARSMNVLSIGPGSDLSDVERLAYRHPN